VQGNFLQALIQLSAANLKYFVGNPAAGCNLIRSGIIRLRNAPPSYLGIDVLTLIEAFQAHMINPRPPAPLILLS
jgi:hypothetical protein